MVFPLSLGLRLSELSAAELNAKREAPLSHRNIARFAWQISRNSSECPSTVVLRLKTSAGLAAELTRSIHTVQFASLANFQKIHANLLESGFLAHPFDKEISAVLLSLNNTRLEFWISFRNLIIANTAANVSNELMWTLPSTFFWTKSEGAFVPNSFICVPFDTVIRHPPIEPPWTDDASV